MANLIMSIQSEVYVPQHRSTSTVAPVPDEGPALSEHTARPGTPGVTAGGTPLVGGETTPQQPTPAPARARVTAPVEIPPDNVFTRARAAGGFPGQLARRATQAGKRQPKHGPLPGSTWTVARILARVGGAA